MRPIIDVETLVTSDEVFDFRMTVIDMNFALITEDWSRKTE